MKINIKVKNPPSLPPFLSNPPFSPTPPFLEKYFILTFIAKFEEVNPSSFIKGGGGGGTMMVMQTSDINSS